MNQSNESDEYRERQQRTRLLVGDGGLERLRNAHVLVLGVGGVGAYAAEQLARAGIGRLTLIDGDEATGRIMGVYVSDDHTPVMLPVFAYGPGSDRFRGTYRNTEIPRRIKSLVK